MANLTLHPDLNPKKIISVTFLPWNIRLIRLLGDLLTPAVKQPDGVKTSVKTLNNQNFRVHSPSNQKSKAALLWIHGGGLIIGNSSVDDAINLEIANKLGITVISISYRLAPQHRFPTAIEDCHKACKTVQNNPETFDIDPSKIIIGGDSAGGGLCANLAQRLRDEGGTQPMAQLLVCPMLDDRTCLRTDIALKETPVWNRRSNITGWSSYLGKENLGAKSLPQYAAASRTEDLSNLPPTWIGVGSIDLFHDEDCDYAERLKSAGVSTTLNVVMGAYHGFYKADAEAKVSRQFVQSILDFLRNHI